VPGVVPDVEGVWDLLVAQHAGQRLPATYLNFYFVNGALLVPTYRHETNDRRALDILQLCVRDEEIDPELFRLFLDAQVYRLVSKPVQ